MIYFATQVVAGTKYCYLCKGVVPHPGAMVEKVVKLYAFKGCNGEVQRSEIIDITP